MSHKTSPKLESIPHCVRQIHKWKWLLSIIRHQHWCCSCCTLYVVEWDQTTHCTQHHFGPIFQVIYNNNFQYLYIAYTRVCVISTQACWISIDLWIKHPFIMDGGDQASDGYTDKLNCSQQLSNHSLSKSNLLKIAGVYSSRKSTDNSQWTLCSLWFIT